MSLLVEDLKKLRNEGWDHILNDTLVVAKNISWPIYLEEELKRIQKRKIFKDNEKKIPDDNQKTIFKR